jgi:hypothetical protein
MPEPIDHIDELQKRLYSRDPENMPKRKFGILHPTRQSVSSTWGDTKVAGNKTTQHLSAARYKRFFAFAFLFFIGALAAALFAYYRGATTLSSKNVDLTILGNSFVAGGEELPIQIEIANKNSADLTNAKLVINYPKGATDETGGDVVRIERSLGTVASGKTKSEEFIAVLYGEQGINRTITATLSYELEGSSASFKKENVFSVMISSSPVGLTVDVPTAVVSNQPFTLTLHNTFSGDKMLPNVVARVEYPNGFIFQSATPLPTANNNSWALGDMQKGDDRTISIVGKLVGEINDEKAFRVYIGTPETETSSKIAVAYNSALATLHIISPFMSGGITIDGKTDDIVALPIGSEVSGSVNWVNTSKYTVTEPTFSLALSGASIDRNSITASNSYYDPLEQTITWTPDSDSDLASLAPGATGELPFSFNTLSSVSGSRDITLGLSLKGVIAELGTMEQVINTIDQKIVRFAAGIQFAAQSLYSVGPIKNTGPYPPKADAETSYTVTWTILPSDNPLSTITASAILPNGVNWAGVIVPSTESVSYSPDTRTVTWNIGSLPKASATPRSKSVSFQVKVKPTKSQVGSPLELIGESTVTATDTVTSTQITTTRAGLTTKFATDPIYTEGRDRVVR